MSKATRADKYRSEQGLLDLLASSRKERKGRKKRKKINQQERRRASKDEISIRCFRSPQAKTEEGIDLASA